MHQKSINHLVRGVPESSFHFKMCHLTLENIFFLVENGAMATVNILIGTRVLGNLFVDRRTLPRNCNVASNEKGCGLDSLPKDQRWMCQPTSFSATKWHRQ